jgi:hypothetical protein
MITAWHQDEENQADEIIEINGFVAEIITETNCR